MRLWLLILLGGLAPVASRADSTDKPATSLETPALRAAGPVMDDGNASFRDSLGAVSVRPVPDAPETIPLCLQRAEYLRKHNDFILGANYLRQIVTDPTLKPQERARAMLELADCLAAENQQGEELCWLKLWTQMYPSRPEMGAVAYRIGTLYMGMGLTDLARDALYLALAHTIDEGQVDNAEDLQRYTQLTTGTLWALAANEHQSGQWARGAQLFDRYRKEAPAASAVSLENAAFLQADCYYQLKELEPATALYEETLAQHPFNPLAPQARLRLYHLYLIKNDPDKAQEELQALAWTIRTAFPRDEVYWQQQTAELLLALNRHNMALLPPLLEQAAHVPAEGKTWQAALDHYDALASYQAITTDATMDPALPMPKNSSHDALVEQSDLTAMSQSLNQTLPPVRTASNQ